MQAVVCDRCGKIIPRQAITKHRSGPFTYDVKIIDGVIEEMDEPEQRALCPECFKEIIAEIDNHTNTFRV